MVFGSVAPMPPYRECAHAPLVCGRIFSEGDMVAVLWGS